METMGSTAERTVRSAPGELPLVTIVVPVWNGEKHLRESLDSILGQSYPRLEVIAVDDASTDSTPAILASYGDRVTVTDDGGRFVSGLEKEDFTVYDDGVRQEVTYFSNDRMPVSLGILLDVSGSMTADKLSTAKAAIDEFIFDLRGKDDELFFM